MKVDKKDEITMKIIHYLVTVEDYKAVIVRGVTDEIWLENQEKYYGIVRINMNYIHNIEQYKLDLNKVYSIRHGIKKKIFKLKLNVLNILINIRNDVMLEDIDDRVTTIKVGKIDDFKFNSKVTDYFKYTDSINSKRLNESEIVSITNELNYKNIEEDKKMQKIFMNKNKPMFTYILIGINIFMYLLSLLNYNGFINLFANYYVNVKNGEIYRLLTSTFIHGSIIHLVCNMYALYSLGIMIEKFYGKKRFLIIYFISGILGSLLTVTLSNNASIGASGAIFGLFGSLLYFSLKYRSVMSDMIKNNLIPVLILNLLMNIFIPGIDMYGHIGGFLAGILLSYILGAPNKENKKDRINGVIILITIVSLLIYLLLQK